MTADAGIEIESRSEARVGAGRGALDEIQFLEGVEARVEEGLLEDGAIDALDNEVDIHVHVVDRRWSVRCISP